MDDVGARWVRSWFAPGQPFLAYPSASNLSLAAEKPASTSPKRTILRAFPRSAHARLPMRSGCSARRNAVRSDLLRAREEAGIEDVFLFPAHDLAGGYTMPEAELLAFERVMRPRLET